MLEGEQPRIRGGLQQAGGLREWHIPAAVRQPAAFGHQGKSASEAHQKLGPPVSHSGLGAERVLEWSGVACVRV